MTVANPQMQLRALVVTGPVGGEVEFITALLIASHYLHVRPGLDHVTAPWQAAEPAVFKMASGFGRRRLSGDDPPARLCRNGAFEHWRLKASVGPASLIR